MAPGTLRSLFRAVMRRDLYNVGVVHAPIHRFLEPHWRPEVRWLPPLPRSGAFIADPFGIVVAGTRYLLCEYFDYREPMGRIVWAALDDAGLIGRLEDALVARCHVSYPFVFAYEGHQFCVPETGRANELALYRMGASPASWTRVAVLLELDAVDASVIEYAGRWWLFCGARRTNGAELLIWHADSPLGPWHPHARQPVKRDPASSRSGGTPFVHLGKLYRPAQDCSTGYGKRVVINEVIALTPDDFEERTAAAVEPDADGPYPDGLHTLSALGGMTLLDGKREQFIPAAVVRSAKNLVRRAAGSERPSDL